MAPAVILIGCLLATMSCVTTAQSTSSAPTTTSSTSSSPTTTTVHPPASTNTTTANPPFTPVNNVTANRPTNSTANPLFTPVNNVTANRPVNSTANPPFTPANNATANPPFTPVNNATANRPVNSTANPTLNATANPLFNATENPPFNASAAPPRDSCANLCCSGKNNSCFRFNCFCDVACLRIGDCCPDFKPTCLTVNNSSNGTKPNNTLTLTGKCSQPTLCCSGLNYDCFRGCFCDEVCKQFNDCCPDLNSTCIFNTTTAAPPVNSTTAPPNESVTILTNLDVEVLAEEWSTEEERLAALRQVGALVESYLRAYNDIYSFEVTRIEPVSSSSSSSPPCD